MREFAGVALTGLHSYKAVAAMGKSLELDGGKRVLRKQKGETAQEGNEPLFHEIFPMLNAANCIEVVSESMGLKRGRPGQARHALGMGEPPSTGRQRG